MYIFILLYLYLVCLNSLLTYLLVNEYIGPPKNFYTAFIFTILTHVFGLIYFTLLKNYVLIAIISTYILSHLIILGFRIKKDLRVRRNAKSYRNLKIQLDDELFNSEDIEDNEELPIQVPNNDFGVLEEYVDDNNYNF